MELVEDGLSPRSISFRIQCCFADYLVSVWSVYFDGLVRGFLTLFRFCRTVAVTIAGLRHEGRWRPENG